MKYLNLTIIQDNLDSVMSQQVLFFIGLKYSVKTVFTMISSKMCVVM